MNGIASGRTSAANLVLDRKPAQLFCKFSSSFASLQALAVKQLSLRQISCAKSFFSAIHPADSEGESLVSHIPEPAPAQSSHEFFLAGEIKDRGRQIPVRRLVSGHLSADKWQNMKEIQIEEPAYDSIGRH